MKTISLTQGKVALVDDKNFDRLNLHKWCAAKYRRGGRDIFYAVRQAKGATVYMHREIIGCDSPMVDHKDSDGLNNQEHNLRAATRANNSSNSRKRPGCASQFKGVYWRKDRECWKAAIRKGTQFFFLGLYDDETEAAHAYDTAAIRHFGEFACLNFPVPASP